VVISTGNPRSPAEEGIRAMDGKENQEIFYSQPDGNEDVEGHRVSATNPDEISLAGPDEDDDVEGHLAQANSDTVLRVQPGHGDDLVS
jgi:hypothetical protein